MNLKVGDRVTWSNYKIANGKIINISDYRPQTMKYAVDFGFNDLVFCGQDDIILLNPAEELEIEQSDIDSDICSKYKKADVCKECDETFQQFDEIIVFDGIAWHKDCLDKFPSTFAYYEKGEEGEFLNTDDNADFDGDAYEYFDGLEEE
ncbi:hypothetical protein QJV38_07100 [Listeria cossartiae subsp. cayugensis]|uniref:Uncharacterized protein n=1 Tax=Listeria cossartiae subsp. cayugensis TaxID=2713505 RepID=A0ABU2IIT2_9LIST|nr:hypothetical protein [Listeria cossartiae]MDT0064589.1 hypothetical protein [Listeria cossartiae subsp. cayugensis]MDT0079807.1 hypothetical protein [Listeria cossartiae subsp. cayugensis]MDT0082643.1 hypothetical protein [Listeria cossartiae subsp. cayugensis]MDT0086822.1 hypothetical protein [Listeria cossartiae subsp. cayugensis]MDT0099260.1 hypothetical protein [Listeria cossartiae subsp. cayugensis]